MLSGICLVPALETGPFHNRHLLRHFLGAETHDRPFTFFMTLYGPGRGQRGDGPWSRSERATDRRKQAWIFLQPLRASSGMLSPSFPALMEEAVRAQYQRFHLQLPACLAPAACEGPGGLW